MGTGQEEICHLFPAQLLTTWGTAFPSNMQFCSTAPPAELPQSWAAACSLRRLPLRWPCPRRGRGRPARRSEPRSDGAGPLFSINVTISEGNICGAGR